MGSDGWAYFFYSNYSLTLLYFYYRFCVFYVLGNNGWSAWGESYPYLFSQFLKMVDWTKLFYVGEFKGGICKLCLTEKFCTILLGIDCRSLFIILYLMFIIPRNYLLVIQWLIIFSKKTVAVLLNLIFIKKRLYSTSSSHINHPLWNCIILHFRYIIFSSRKNSILF